MSTVISDITTICTAPDGIRLVIVKVTTSDDGLYGLGCATFTQRPTAVVAAIRDYLRPLLIGRDVDRIEDIWQVAHHSAYWRGGPILNNALSGVDMALWDIKGKRAGMPLYQLLGGRVRDAVRAYVHVNGADVAALVSAVRSLMQRGFSAFRCQIGSPGASYGTGPARETSLGLQPTQSYRLDLRQPSWDPRSYLRAVPAMFESVRNELGDEVEFIHDVHERVAPIDALRLARDLEPYRLFYLEDPVAPEDQDCLRWFRRQCSTPIALGELYTDQSQFLPAITGRLIDFVRVHISDIGGITPARKLAVLCEFHGVRTAWHGPGDVSPVGHAANLHLDLVTPNFGIQEAYLFGDACREVFPGCPEIVDGAMHASARPGLGVDLDERAAAACPYPEHSYNGAWPEIRLVDGTVIRP